MYKRVWRINCELNGFQFVIMVNTQEQYLQAYLNSELGKAWKTYRGASEKEVFCHKGLGLPIYEYKQESEVLK